MRSLTAAAAFGAVLLTQGAVEAAEVTVLASTALRPILTELAPRFEGDTSHKLAITYEAMGALKRQIEAGEPFDVVIMTPPSAAAFGWPTGSAKRATLARPEPLSLQEPAARPQAAQRGRLGAQFQWPTSTPRRDDPV